MAGTASYFITAATALAIGIVGTLAVNGITEVQAFTDIKREQVSFDLGAGAASTFKGFLNAQGCAVVDTKYSLTGGNVCTANWWQKVCFSRYEDEEANEFIRFSGAIDLKTNYTVEAP